LARRAGSTVAAAAAAIETAARLEALAATAAAFRAGQLSEVQAREIASAAAGHPEREAELLAVAGSDSVQGLRLACRAAQAADRADDTAAHRAVHRGRYPKHGVDDDGAARLSARLTVEDMATVLAAVDAFEAEVFAQARAEGRVEPYHAYRADALVAVAAAVCAGSGTGTGRRVVTVDVLVDHAAVLRGRVEPGETCEIAGVGPIAVATARALMADAFINVLDTDGVEVYRVAHLGRAVTAHQRTALEVRDRECVIPGCHVTSHLEIDHVEEWAATHVTRLDALARLCHFHHAQKTYDGWRLEGTPGHWQWLPPASTRASAA